MLAVTIGVTAYNCEDTLETAVNSALSQDYNEIKILIVDDCSSDNTNAIARGLAKLHPNVALIRSNKNQGVAASRNIIIDNANSPFIAFFDDDDISQPNRISSQLEAILACETETKKELILCHTARVVVYTNGVSRYQQSLAQVAGSVLAHVFDPATLALGTK